MVGEWIGLIAPLAAQVGLDVRRRELRFPHRHRHPERENRVHETMGISNTDEAFAAELFHLKRVVRNHVHGFGQLDLRDAQFETGVKLVQLADVEIAEAFLLLQKIADGSSTLTSPHQRVILVCQLSCRDRTCENWRFASSYKYDRHRRRWCSHVVSRCSPGGKHSLDNKSSGRSESLT